MRTTVTLDDDVYEAAVAHSRATGKRLGKVLSEMARHALRAPGPPRRRSGKKPRFASFVVPRGTKPILASRVQQALDEDGIV
jgi:hypothetical protein